MIMPYRVYFMESHNVNMWDIFLENEILTAISRLTSLSQYFFIWFVAYKILISIHASLLTPNIKQQISLEEIIVLMLHYMMLS